MKKIIQYAMVASLFVACNNRSDLDTNKDVVLTDTTGMYRSNIMTDTGSLIQTTALTDANRNTAVANRRISTSRTTSYPQNTSVSRSNSSTNAGQTTTVTRRKGWSHAAKNAVIGGVGGAVTGAIISKKKGKGAVIGGVLGAAGGYILGRSKDKREGRY